MYAVCCFDKYPSELLDGYLFNSIRHKIGAVSPVWETQGGLKVSLETVRTGKQNGCFGARMNMKLFVNPFQMCPYGACGYAQLIGDFFNQPAFCQQRNNFLFTTAQFFRFWCRRFHPGKIIDYFS